MTKYDITRSELTARLENWGGVDSAAAETLVADWSNGGTCALIVAAALCTLIADKYERVAA